MTDAYYELWLNMINLDLEINKNICDCWLISLLNLFEFNIWISKFKKINFQNN
jgi:hypothetical protein